MEEKNYPISLAGGITLAIIGVCLILAMMYFITPKENVNPGVTVSTSVDETMSLLNGEYLLPNVGEEVKTFAATLYYKEHSKETLNGLSLHYDLVDGRTLIYSSESLIEIPTRFPTEQRNGTDYYYNIGTDNGYNFCAVYFENEGKYYQACLFQPTEWLIETDDMLDRVLDMLDP